MLVVLSCPPTRVVKQTLAKAKEIATRHLVGKQVMWGRHGGLIKDIRLPAPLVHDWAVLLGGRTGRKRAVLSNLTIDLAVIGAGGKESGTRKLVNLVDIVDELESYIVAGEVVAMVDPRGTSEWLVARTLDVSYDSVWRTVLEMEVNQGGHRKEMHAIEPYLQLVHADELLFRD